MGMRSMRITARSAIILAALTLTGNVVQANTWGKVARGFQLFDYQFSGERNYLGNGWTLNADVIYTGQTYNMGLATLQLGADSPARANMSMGYTLRGIPKASFDFSTSGPLSYNFEIDTGLQDFRTVRGSILYDVHTDVNLLGFYDTHVQISNRGDYSTSGLLGQDGGTLAFDIGTIDVSGNVYADALAALFQPLFDAAGTENPFAKFSSAAAKTASLEASTQELRSKVAAGEILTDTEIEQLINNTVTLAVLKGESFDAALADALPPPTTSDSEPLRTTSFEINQVPEPATGLLTLAMGLALVVRRRPR